MKIISAQFIAESNQISDYLTSRPLGRLFAAALENELNETEEAVVVIQFSGVQLMDASFADEVFGNWAAQKSRRKSIHDIALFLQELDEASLENLDMALTARTRKEKNLRNCVIPYIEPSGGVKLLGKWENHVEETFAYLVQNKKLTTHQLVNFLNLDVAAASTRLKVLYDLGLAIRSTDHDTGDRQYVYHLPV